MGDWEANYQSPPWTKFGDFEKEAGNEAVLRVKYVTEILIRIIVGCPSTHMGNITEFIGNSGYGKTPPSDLS